MSIDASLTRPPLRTLFYGTPEFAACGLRSLLADPAILVVGVVTQPDRPSGRGAQLRPSPVKTLALEHNLPVLQPLSIRKQQAEFIAELQAIAPLDIAVVIAFGQILPAAVLEIPRAGSVNVHASILPRWRGAAPIQRALMAGDHETGVCLMKMEAGLDTGPVYVEARETVRTEDTFASLHDRLATLGASLLARHLPQIASGKISAIPQADTGVTYAPKITNEEARIDWTKPASEISLLVRGLSPAPGAYSSLQGKRLKILNARVGPTRGDQAPGTISHITPEGIEVVCGTATLLVTELQIEGKRRMAVNEFLRGTSIPQHSQLGS